MLEEMIKKLLEMDWLSRCFVTNIILADEIGALVMMEGCLRTNLLTGGTPIPSEAILESCKAGWEAEAGYHRSEFLIDLMASIPPSEDLPHVPNEVM
jgi:hypothetical protein